MDRIAQVAETWDAQLDALGHSEKWEKRFKTLATQGRASLDELDTLTQGVALTSHQHTDPAPPPEPTFTSLAPELTQAPPESWFPLSDALEPSDMPGEAGDLADMLEPQAEELPSTAALDAQRTTMIQEQESHAEADRSYEEFLKSLDIPEGSGVADTEPPAALKPIQGAPFRVAPPPPPPPPPPPRSSRAPGVAAPPAAVAWPPIALSEPPQSTKSVSEEPGFDQDSTDFSTDFDGDGPDEFHTRVSTSDSIMAALKRVAEEQGAARNSILFRSIAPEPTAEAEVEEVLLLDQDMDSDLDADNLTDVEAQASTQSGWPEDTLADQGDDKTESDEVEPEKKGFFKRLFKSKE